MAGRCDAGKVDLAIDVRGEFPLALILWLCGARRRLGWSAGGGGFLLTDSARFVPDRPEIESRAALLAELGIRTDGPKDLRPVFRPTRDARRAVCRRLARLLPRERTVVLHVSAGTSAKQWPIEHWRELLGRLIVDHGVQVVLVGSRSDGILAQSILAGRTWPGVFDWTGQLGVVELAALLERAQAMVGADSGPAHLAAAVGTPVVALFSGTNNPSQWRPPGDRVTVLRHPVACSPCHRERCPLAGHPCMNGPASKAGCRRGGRASASTFRERRGHPWCLRERKKESHDDRPLAASRDSHASRDSPFARSAGFRCRDVPQGPVARPGPPRPRLASLGVRRVARDGHNRLRFGDALAAR